VAGGRVLWGGWVNGVWGGRLLCLYLEQRVTGGWGGGGSEAESRGGVGVGKSACTARHGNLTGNRPAPSASAGKPPLRRVCVRG